MPVLAPFRGIRFAVTGRALGNVLAPPYDVISPAQREALAARSPHNVVRIVLPQPEPGDVPGSDRYSRAAAEIQAWRAEGVLREDPRPALYGLEQVFASPDGRERVRRGFVAAVRLHDLREGLVRAHESTLAGPLADRLELLRHVKTNLSPVFGLFEDPRGEVAGALAPAFQADPVAAAETDDGVRQRLWRIDDPAAVAEVQRAFADRRILIADGHHRYEAALAHRDRIDREEPGLPPDAGHRWSMMFLVATTDPGLLIYPTHRLLRAVEGLRVADLVQRLEPYFEVAEVVEDIRRPTGRAWAISRLSEHLGKSSAFLLVTAEDRRARLLTLRDGADLSGLPLPADQNLRALDVSVLHGAVLEGVLGLSRASQDRQENLAYVRDAGEAVARTLDGEFQAAFLLNPTPMWQVQAVADAGLTMPQKSTGFHPKIPSGLVMRSVDPHGPP
jgi:uncharacterized protein (DUF1015 family)